MIWQEYIESNPKIMLGKPVIRGTRITVELILEKLSRGETLEDLILSYPTLSKKSIMACLSYAAKAVKNELVYSITS